MSEMTSEIHSFPVSFKKESKTQFSPLPTRRRPMIEELNKEFREAHDDVAKAAVRIVTPHPVYERFGGIKIEASVGSGFIIDRTPEGKIVIATNRHVVEDPRFHQPGVEQQMIVQTAKIDDKNEVNEFLSGKVVYKSPEHDLAFIEIDTKEHPEANFSQVSIDGDSKHLKVPDFLLTVGSPLGIADTVNVGHVSQAHLTNMPGLEGYDDYRQIDVSSIGGKSGSMVVDPSFDPPVVVGMTTQGVPGESSIGFMLPVEVIKSEYEKHKADKASGKIEGEETFSVRRFLEPYFSPFVN